MIGATPCVRNEADIAGSVSACIGCGGGGGAVRESREDTQRVGKVDPAVKDEGVKYDCVRCTSGFDMRMGGGESEGDRLGEDGEDERE